ATRGAQFANVSDGREATRAQQVLAGNARVAPAVPATLPPLPAKGVERMLALAEAGKEPLRGFLIKHSHNAERGFFLKSAQRLLPPARRADLTVNDFIVIVPAFTVSELTAAFQIGFLIFLPFLVIDLVVANILLALGMMMLSPTTISLPFKLLLFVLIDGWAKLVHGLVLTYGS
ncbi:MAG: EscR/YscR/HrcR family type III secretion system export apparatus protein, partial [Luteimonas sp.]